MNQDLKNALIWLWHNHLATSKEIDDLLTGDESPESRWSCWASQHHQNLALSSASRLGDEIRAMYGSKGISLLVKGELSYPAKLSEAPGYIPIISVCGSVEVLQRSQVAIVGSRETTETARGVTPLVAAALMTRGFVVTSGGALGIDALAHREAMRLGQPTVVVTATDVDQVYPHDNADIFDYARRFGAVVSQYPIRTDPQRTLFPSRNTLMAALSEATCIVQCRCGSGALYTAEASHKLGRPTFVVASNGFNEFNEGGLELVKRQKAALVSVADDFDVIGRGDADNRAVNMQLGLTPLFEATSPRSDAGRPAKSRVKTDKLGNKPGELGVHAVERGARGEVAPEPVFEDDLASAIYASLAVPMLGRDELARRTSCDDLARLTQTLLDMEFDGYVECVAGRYRRTVSKRG